jgi:hypothetical protein
MIGEEGTVGLPVWRGQLDGLAVTTQPIEQVADEFRRGVSAFRYDRQMIMVSEEAQLSVLLRGNHGSKDRKSIACLKLHRMMTALAPADAQAEQSSGALVGQGTA